MHRYKHLHKELATLSNQYTLRDFHTSQVYHGNGEPPAKEYGVTDMPVLGAFPIVDNYAEMQKLFPKIHWPSEEMYKKSLPFTYYKPMDELGSVFNITDLQGLLLYPEKLEWLRANKFSKKNHSLWVIANFATGKYCAHPKCAQMSVQLEKCTHCSNWLCSVHGNTCNACINHSNAA